MPTREVAETRRHAALSGAVAAGLAIGISELAGGVLTTVPSLVVSVAGRVIDITPAPLVHLGIQVLGTNDKPFLVAIILIVVLAIGAKVGQITLTRPWCGPLAYAVFGIAGLIAAAGENGASLALTGVTTLVAGCVGAGALWALIRVDGRATGSATATDESTTAPTRRAFLGLLGGLALVAVAAAAGGRLLLNQVASAARDLVHLPRPTRPAPPLPPGASLNVDGITPIVSSNDTFYRIDTAITVPHVDAGNWSLTVKGMVDHPFNISFADLLAMPMIEEYVTLTCVSNEVGGNLAGNARWLGVPLSDLLKRAGVKPGATQVVGRSVDGFTVGLPTEAANDGRVAMVAVGMNGETLPFDHGYPARLVVAGLYGYVSATKWLSELELTTFAAYNAFWIDRGWAQQAPIKTESRIDVPRAGKSLSAGNVAIAGVAWAQSRGISRVEVQVDNGPWMSAQLAEAIGVNSWRQWVLQWSATAGSHTIAVRATDGHGDTQTATVQGPVPDGATGYHTIRVDVSS